MTHELKIQKQWADAKLAGEKPFEIRRNDRGFQKGDTVRYTVVDPKTGEPWRGSNDGNGSLGSIHPLECCTFIITYVREGADGLERGYCVYAEQPTPGEAAKNPAGAAKVRGETFYEGFMRHTNDRLDRIEQIVLPAKGLAERYGIADAAEPARHRTGICECADLTKRSTCPYRLVKANYNECFNPGECEGKRTGSADLGSGATPSNGTAEPSAPPPPLAES